MIKITILFGIISSIGGLLIIYNFVIDKIFRKKLRIKSCKIFIRKDGNIEMLKFDIKNFSNWDIRILEMGFILRGENQKVKNITSHLPLTIKSKNLEMVNFHLENHHLNKISDKISNIKKLYICHNTGKDYIYRKKMMLIRALKEALKEAKIIGQF